MGELSERYKDFAHEITHEFRYVLSPESQDFLGKLVLQAEERVLTLPIGSVLYRARANGIPLGDTIALKHAYPLDQMKPIKNVVREGRANPSNICALYLASEVGTAIAEVRPSTNHPVTVGTFRTERELRIVDLTAQMGWHAYFFVKDYIWQNLSVDFSKPLNEQHQSLHYAKTQIIAETFKRHGYDGIRYRSQFYAREKQTEAPYVKGFNFALFDLASATCESCKVYQIAEQHVVFREMDI